MTKNELIKKLKNEGVNTNNLDHWSLSIEGFNWILNSIPKNKSILEIGAGKGTAELSKFWNVTTVESNIQWVNYVKEADYIYAPLSSEWYNIDILHSDLPKKYDFLIIDGPVGSSNRVPILDHLELFYLDCPILVDDVHAPASLFIAESLGKILNRGVTVHKGWQKSFATIL